LDQEPSSKTEPTAEQPPSPWVPVDPSGHPENNHAPGQPPEQAFTEPAPVPAGPYVAGYAPASDSPHTSDLYGQEPAADTLERPSVHPVFPMAVPPGTEPPVLATAAPEPDTPAAPEPEPDASPNWMLAFVCAWAGSFAAYQAWDVTRRTDLTRVLHNLALGGYTALGIGLFLCALEALLWGKLRRRGATQLMLLLVPLILIFVGVVCLIVFKDPDPTRSKI
jgi:hypothetical protein